jgi:type IV secretory pathway TrbF-like protein
LRWSGGRIGQAQRFSGSKYRCSGLVGILLAIIGFGIVYYQRAKSKGLGHVGNPERGTPIAESEP